MGKFNFSLLNKLLKTKPVFTYKPVSSVLLPTTGRYGVRNGKYITLFNAENPTEPLGRITYSQTPEGLKVENIKSWYPKLKVGEDLYNSLFGLSKYLKTDGVVSAEALNMPEKTLATLAHLPKQVIRNNGVYSIENAPGSNIRTRIFGQPVYRITGTSRDIPLYDSLGNDLYSYLSDFLKSGGIIKNRFKNIL